MKKLLFAIYLLTCAPGFAQTKADTERFIAKCMHEAVGLITYASNEGKRVEKRLYEENIFGADRITVRQARQDYSRGSSWLTATYSNLNWANVISIVLDTVPSLYHEDDVATITLGFVTKIKYTEHCESGTYNVACDNTDYWNGFTIIVPRNRGASCKKALEHWVKIHREADSRDNPFGD